MQNMKRRGGRGGESRMKKIVVVGSLNMDYVIEAPHMPVCGETLSGRSVTLVPGGKGANQAYAV